MSEVAAAAAPAQAHTAVATGPAAPSWADTMSAKFEPEALNNLYRQISAMLHSGVPLVTALTSISGGAYSARIRSALEEIRLDVNQGNTISEVVERRKDIFPPLHAALIRAAEQGGFLDRAFGQLANYLSEEIEVRNQWKWTTFYPKLLLAVTFIIILVANLIIKIVSSSSGGPALYLSNILLSPWIGGPILAIGIVVFLFLRTTRTSVKAQMLRDQIALRVPYYGSIAQIFAIAKFSRALALLYGGGVPIREAALLAADASGNLVIAERVKPLAKKLNEGGTIWDALQQSGIFTDTALDMVRAGEISGSLQSLLEHLANHYEGEGKLRMRKFTTVVTMAVLILVLLIVVSSIFGFWMGYANLFKSYLE